MNLNLDTPYLNAAQQEELRQAHAHSIFAPSADKAIIGAFGGAVLYDYDELKKQLREDFKRLFTDDAVPVQVYEDALREYLQHLAYGCVGDAKLPRFFTAAIPPSTCVAIYHFAEPAKPGLWVEVKL